jgi:hypothetical protein
VVASAAWLDRRRHSCVCFDDAKERTMPRLRMLNVRYDAVNHTVECAVGIFA